MTPDFHLLPDCEAYDAAVDLLYAEAFGPGRHAKAAARLREGHACRRDVSFVALQDDRLIGACRLWPLVTDQGQDALFLGPIAVASGAQNKGLGGRLVEACLSASDRLTGLPIILVGDLAFFQPFGFERLAKGQIQLPGPVDHARLLTRPATDRTAVPPKGRVLIKRF